MNSFKRDLRTTLIFLNHVWQGGVTHLPVIGVGVLTQKKIGVRKRPNQQKQPHKPHVPHTFFKQSRALHVATRKKSGVARRPNLDPKYDLKLSLIP